MTAVARMFAGAFDCPVYDCDLYAAADSWSDIAHWTVQLGCVLPSIMVETLHVVTRDGNQLWNVRKAIIWLL